MALSLTLAAVPCSAQVSSYAFYGADRNVPAIDRLDANTLAVVDQVQVGGGTTAIGFVVTRDGSRAYYWRPYDLTLTAVDLQSHAVLAQRSLGNWVSSTVVSADGSKLYVPSQSAGNATVSVLNALTLADLGSIPLPGEGGRVLSASPDGRWLLVDEDGWSTLSIVDLRTNSIVGTPGALQNMTGRAAFSPSGTRAFVGGAKNTQVGGRSGIYVVDPQRAVPLSFIEVPDYHPGPGVTSEYRPGQMVLSPNGRNLYTVHSGARTLLAIDIVDGIVQAQVPLPSRNYDFHRLLVSGDGSRVYVSTGLTVTIVDTASNMIIADLQNVPADLSASAGYFSGSALQLDGAAGIYGTAATLGARLTDASGIGHSGASIEFTFQGTPIGSAVTDAFGIARIDSISLAGLQVGTYADAVGAFFAGDGSLGAASMAAPLHVFPATPVLTWNQPPRTLFGTPLGAAELNATASVPGTFTYSPPAGTVLSIGNTRVTVTFTPDDYLNYLPAFTHQTIVVAWWSDDSSPTLLEPLLSPATRFSGPSAIAIDPIAERIYSPVTEYVTYGISQGRVAILDARTDAVVGVIGNEDLPDHPSLWRPQQVATDPEHRRLYVTGSSFAVTVSSFGTALQVQFVGLWIFDISGAVPVLAPLPVNPIPVPYPFGVAVNGNTDLLYVASNDELWVIDPLATSHPLARVSGVLAHVPIVDTARNRVYVQAVDGLDNGRLLVINADPARGPLDQVLGTLDGMGPTPPWGESATLDRTAGRLYVTQWAVGFGGRLSVFDVSGPPVVGQVPTRTISLPDPVRYPFAAAVNPSTHTLYVVVADQDYAFDGGAVLSAFDPMTLAPLSHTMLSPGWYADTYPAWPYNAITVNPATSRIYVGSSWFKDRIQEISQFQAAIVPGQPSTAGGVTLQFPPQVGGQVTASVIDPGDANPTLPGQFRIDGALAYEISTDPPLPSQLSAPINVCFDAAGVSDPDLFGSLAVFHLVNGAWRQETTVTSHDFATGLICVDVTSLSPFVLAPRVQPYTMAPLYDQTRSFKAGSTVPIKLQLRDASGLNVSSPSINVRLKRMTKLSSAASGAIQDAGHANPDQTFRYDAAVAGYIFNFQTKGLQSGTYQLGIKAGGDTRILTLTLQIR